MRGTFNWLRLVLAALVLLVVAPLLAGCSTPHKEIDAIGVVVSIGPTVTGDLTTYRITFEDGRVYEMPGGPMSGSDPGPSPGDLLIAGSKPDNWMLVARLRDPFPDLVGPCYGLVENGDERDTTVELDFGVTLQKAPDFEEGGRNPKNSTRITGGVICLNRDGQVRRIF